MANPTPDPDVEEGGAEPTVVGGDRTVAFSDIYRTNAWGSDESRSGPGSTLSHTAEMRTLLPAALHQLGVRSLLDAACGDHNWMSSVELGDIRYLGVDVVADVVAANASRYAGREFQVRDIVSDQLPYADAIFCRHALPHLSVASVLGALENFRRSGSWLLITSTFPAQPVGDTTDGGFFPHNLEGPPFRLPPPLERIPEENPRFPCEYLGIWELNPRREPRTRAAVLRQRPLLGLAILVAVIAAGGHAVQRLVRRSRR